MSGLLPFLIILIAGLIFSDIFRRLHLPYVTALIVAGVIIGPSVLDIIVVDPAVSFLGTIGVVFLMFIAGSEIKTGSFKALGRDVFIIAILNSVMPFLTGFGLAYFFGFDMFVSLTLGVVFVSSSIAVIIPSLESNDLIKTKVGRLITASTVMEDILSLILLAFVLQMFTQKTPIPLYLYIPAVILLIVGLKILIPKLQKIYSHGKRAKDRFEGELRFIFTVLIASVILFEFMGMHAIIAGFIIGLILSDSIKNAIEEKIRTISYGLFIPTFFLIIGIETDFSVFFSNNTLALTVAIVLGLVLSKIISGYLGGRIIKLTNKESLLVGVASTPQLSTTLAAAFVAMEFGLLTSELVASLVILSVTTTLFAPMAIKMLASYKDIKQKPGSL